MNRLWASSIPMLNKYRSLKVNKLAKSNSSLEKCRICTKEVHTDSLKKHSEECLELGRTKALLEKIEDEVKKCLSDLSQLSKNNRLEVSILKQRIKQSKNSQDESQKVASLSSNSKNNIVELKGIQRDSVAKTEFENGNQK